MDSVSRLIRCVLLVAALCGCTSAAYAVQALRWSVNWSIFPAGFASPSAACDAWGSKWAELNTHFVFVRVELKEPRSDGVPCDVIYKFPGSNTERTVNELVTSAQVEVPDPPPTCEPDKTLGDSSSKWYWKGSGSTTCQQGCLYIADTFAHDKTSGYSVGWGKLNGLGVSCSTGNESAGETPPDNKPPNRCEAGKCPGTVNGVTVCVKCGGKTGAVDDATKEETKDADGEGGADPETTTTKTSTKTTCENGECETETTTTTMGPGGTKTETTKDKESEDSFCQKNPQHKLCKETESEFGGSCQGGFRCEGDAVQCAIAREQHQRMCQLLDTETDLSLLGERLGTGQEDGSIRDQLGAGAAPVDVSSHLGNAPALGPTSGCPADVSVGQYVLPFSELCGQLNTLGNALVGFAWLVAAFIVFRKGAD